MKKLIISLSILASIIGFTLFFLHKVVMNGEVLATELETMLESVTGREVQVSQSPVVSLFPPRVSFRGIKVANLKGASSEDFISVAEATFNLSIGALFTGKATPSQILLDGTVIDFEALPTGQRNWQFIEKKQDGNAFRNYFLKTPVTLKNTLLRYNNASTGAFTQIGGINGILRYEGDGKQFTYTGKVDISSIPADVEARMDSVDLTQENVPNVPFEMTIKHLESVLKVKGEMASASRDPEFIGEVDVELPSIGYLLTVLESATEKPDSGDQAVGKVTAKGAINIGIKRLKLQDVNILATGGDTIPALKGKLDAEYQFGKHPVLALAPHFESVDVDFLRRVYNGMVFPEAVALKPVRQETEEQTAEQAEKEAAEKLKGKRSWDEFLAVLQGRFDFKIDNLIYNGRSLKSIEVQSTFNKGNIAINLGRANLPGDTWLVFSGLSRMTDRGTVYDGKLEVQGRQMEEFLALFAEQNVNVPPMELGLFGMRANMALTSAQFRLSEMQARVADTRLAGAMIFHRGDRLRLESFMRIANINLDTVKKAAMHLAPKDEGVSTVDTGQGGDRLFNVEYSNTAFNWLTSVGMDIEADMLLENFVFDERKGDRAKFTFGLKVGEISLRNVDADYNNAHITGDYAIKAETGKNPFIDVNATISNLDLADVLPAVARVQNDDEWQAFIDKPLDLLALQTYRGKFAVKAGKLTIRGYEFENIDFAASLDKDKLDIEKMDGNIWGGGVQFRGSIQAGTIPALSFAFVLDNANLVRLSQMTALVKHAAGQIGLRGQIATSGVALRSWFKNASGAVSVVGQEVSIQGFGMSTLARAVPVARAVADLVSAKRSSLEGGVARFTTLEGQLTVNNGQLEVTRGTFSSEEVQGGVSGSMNMLNESVDLLAEFYLMSTVKKNQKPPKMTLMLRGPIDNVKKEIEMQDVEAYVAREAAERSLQN